MDIIFATNNQHKIKEVSILLPSTLHLKSLGEIGFSGDIPEEEPTIEGNAKEKAKYIFKKYGEDCFADDTGLEIEALGGEPGVFSARYALMENPYIEKKNISNENVRKVLHKLHGEKNRNARFKTVICLILHGEEFLFEGIINGKIIEEEKGNEGFGYDPIFVPEGYKETFAEMDLAIKNKISHRGKAVEKLVKFLKQKA